MRAVKKKSAFFLLLSAFSVPSRDAYAVTSLWPDKMVSVTSEYDMRLVALAGAVMAGLGGYMIWNHVPTVLLWRARRMIWSVKESAQMQLVIENVANEHAFFEHIDAFYICYPYARMTAQDALMNMLSNVQKAINFICQVQYAWVQESKLAEIKDLLSEARMLERHLMLAIATIKRMPDYCEQRKAYEEKIAAEKLRTEIRFATR